MARLPIVGGDNNTWGNVLVDYLSVSIEDDGELKPAAVELAGDGIFARTPLVSVRASNYSPAVDKTEAVLVDASSTSVSVSLPTAVNNKNLYTVKKIDSSSNNVVITTNGSETIDGGASALLKVRYVSITVVSDGSNWSVI